MIRYTTAQTKHELQQILDLQARNLFFNVSSEEAIDQGFLSMQIELSMLEKIPGQYRHVIAKHDDTIVGYTLVMLREFRNAFDLLLPMFDEFDRLEYKGRKLADVNYFVMGQVCVAKEYRGLGIFNGLYRHLKHCMKDHFDLTVTEIATRNTRSMHAHGKVGFKVMKKYLSPQHENWAIVCWDWH